jgi:hypothetical protein
MRGFPFLGRIVGRTGKTPGNFALVVSKFLPGVQASFATVRTFDVFLIIHCVLKACLIK